MATKKSTTQQKDHQFKSKTGQRVDMTLTMLGLVGLVTGCNTALAKVNPTNATQQQPFPSVTPTNTATTLPLPTFTPLPPTATPTNTPLPTMIPSPTPWPSPTPIPTATPWPTPAAWRPAQFTPPTLEPVPVVPTAVNPGFVGLIPVEYSPPDVVDVFGNTILRWTYSGELAPDEWFDIKIKPLGSENSAFVDWTRSTEYELRSWSGWTGGVYTWQIGIVKGYKEGETKHFIADTGRDSEKFIIKWQAPGGDSGGGGGGNGGSGGGGGGGGASGGS